MTKFTYAKVGKTLSGSKRPEILNVLKAGGKELKKRLADRGIKIPTITRARVSEHNQVETKTGTVVSHAQKFHLRLKDGSKAVVNLSKYF